MREIDAPVWMADANCAGMDTDIFFPDKGTWTTEPAKVICAECEVINPCLAYALHHHIIFGIWGGTTDRERRSIRRRANRTVA